MRPDKFDPHFISQTFFPTHSLETINYGSCFEWAYLAFKIFHKVDICLWSTEECNYHAFIKIGDKFYDSEAHDGRMSWRQLPCNMRNGSSIFTKAKEFKLKEYKTYWAYTEKFWQELDKKVDFYI